MKKILTVLALSMAIHTMAWALSFEELGGLWQKEDPMSVFRRNIPAIAEKFIGLPYEWGGDPRMTGTTDNSHLFFSIYSMAAASAKISYPRYLTIKELIKKTQMVPMDQIQNGDLMVLNNTHAAMVYRVEKNGVLHLIYASGKRRQVTILNSESPSYKAYWIKNLKGFHRPAKELFQVTP